MNEIWTEIMIPGLQDNSLHRSGKFKICHTLPAAMGMGGGYIPFLIMERDERKEDAQPPVLH